MSAFNATIRSVTFLLVAAMLPLQPLAVLACSCSMTEPARTCCQSNSKTSKSCCQQQTGKSCCSSRSENKSRTCCQSKTKSALSQCNCCDHQQPEPQQNHSRNPLVQLLDISAPDTSLTDELTLCRAEQLEPIIFTTPQGNLQQAQLGVWLN